MITLEIVFKYRKLQLLIAITPGLLPGLNQYLAEDKV